MRLPVEWRWFGAGAVKNQSGRGGEDEQKDENGFAHSGLEYIHRLRVCSKRLCRLMIREE